MLKHVYVENFRAFGAPTTIPLAPITLFFGENSAGKTSVIHALSLLKQSIEADEPDAALVPRDRTGSLDLGTFSDFVFDHDVDRTLRIGVGISTAENPRVRSRFAATAGPATTRGVTWSFAREGKSHDIRQREVTLSGPQLSAPLVSLRPEAAESDPVGLARSMAQGFSARYSPDPGSYPRLLSASLIEAMNNHRDELAVLLEQMRTEVDQVFFIPDVERHRVRSEIELLLARSRSGLTEQDATSMLRRLWGRPVGFRGLVPPFLERDPTCLAELVSRTGSRQANPRNDSLRQVLREHPLGMLKSVLAAACAAIRSSLGSFTPIGPFRSPPARIYTYAGRRPRHVGSGGELLAELLHRDKELLKRANRWMDTFKSGYRLQVRPLGRRTDVFELRLVDRQRKPRIDVAFADVGFGISQMLPIIVQAAGSKDRIISIEQPEVHIHPRLQAEVGNLLVESMRENNHQFLIETHSEHLILRLRRLVREKKLRPHEITVVHVRRGPEGSIVEQIGINEDGTFADEWPGGFFPERLKELL